METDRDTKEIILPISKSKIVIHTWLNGREYQEVQDAILSGVSLNAAELQANPNSFALKADSLNKGDIKALELLIVNFDGDENEPFKKLQETDWRDYKTAMDEIRKITQANPADLPEEKKISNAK